MSLMVINLYQTTGGRFSVRQREIETEGGRDGEKRERKRDVEMKNWARVFLRREKLLSCSKQG